MEKTLMAKVKFNNFFGCDLRVIKIKDRKVTCIYFSCEVNFNIDEVELSYY